jgi:uncharacterized NAD-dependent epimerase/dehydratase family protein
VLTLNHENMSEAEIEATVQQYERQYGIPCGDVLVHGPDKLVRKIMARFFSENRGKIIMAK